jgi:hypothetical protein
MLVLYKFGRCKVVLGREAEGERPISANGKSRAYNLLFQARKQLQCVPGCVLSRSKDSSDLCLPASGEANA